MPELPEVESVVRSLKSGSFSLLGRRVEKVDLLWQPLVLNMDPERFTRILIGMFFVSIGRYGKYIILGLARQDCKTPEAYFVVHLRMTGKLFLDQGSSTIGPHCRATVLLDNGGSLLFEDSRKFGKVCFVNDIGTIIDRLGPDALKIELAEFESRTYRYNRQIKPLLLDQSFIAGIGNIYADEILFRSGIHPRTLTGSLSDDEVRLLYRSVISVLAEAVDGNGANINDTFKEGNFIVSVYGRDGQPCRKCGSSIVKIRVAQRGTHLCNNCQPLRDII